MRLASLNARISRWAVTGFASTVLAITALAPGASAPAALADVEPASAVSQEETEFTDAQTDVTSPTDQNGGVAANDGLSSSGDDLLMTTDADGLVGTDYYFDGLDDGSLSQGPDELGGDSGLGDGGDQAFVGDEQRYRQQYQQSMSPKPKPTPAQPTVTIECYQAVAVAELFKCPTAPKKGNVLNVELSLGLPSKLQDSLAGKIAALTGKKNVVKIVIGCKVDQVDDVGGNYVVKCTPFRLGISFKGEIGVNAAVTGIEPIVLPVQLTK